MALELVLLLPSILEANKLLALRRLPSLFLVTMESLIALILLLSAQLLELRNALVTVWEEVLALMENVFVMVLNNSWELTVV